MTRRALWIFGVAAALAAPRPVRAETELPGEKQYAEIQTAFLREDFHRVVQLVKPPGAQITVQPRSARVWLWYVVSLEHLQRTAEALQELDRLHAYLVGADPAERERSWPEALFWDGEISRRARKMVRARMAYQRLLTTFPASSWRPPAQRGLGLVLFDQQMYDAALQQFQDAAAQLPPAAPLRDEMLLLEGLCDIRLRRFEDGLVKFRDVLQQDPSAEAEARARAAFYLAEALTGLRRFDDAIHAYTAVIEQDPESRWAGLAQFGLGWSYFQQHRCSKSLGAFQAYRASAPARLDDTPDLAEAHVEMLFAEGRCCMELSDDAAALERFEDLRAGDPEHDLAIEAGLSMAEIFERRRQFEEATAVLETVLRHAFDPSQVAHAHVRSGSVALAQGDPVRATTHFLMAKDVGDPAVRQGALNGLGEAYAALGNLEEALRSYEESLRVDERSPAGFYAMYQLGRLKLQIGKPEEAVALFRKLMDESAPSAGRSEADPAVRTLAAEARLAFAFTLLSQAQPDVARQELEALRAKDPGSPQAARAGYYLALLAVHEGQLPEAVTLCETVIRRAPQSDEALEAHLLLADLVASQASPREALAQLLTSVESLPQIPDRHRGRFAKKLGDLARQVQDFSEAIHWYELAWEAWPALQGELEYRMASCYEEAGDVPVAAHRYRSIAQAPWRVRGQLAAAKLMEREARWPEALAIYEFITREPVPEAKIAQERLALLEQAGVKRP